MRRMKSLTLRVGALVVSVFGLSLPSMAQIDHDGALWEMWLGQGSLKELGSGWENFRWWLDVQARWRHEGEELDTTIVRPGIGYAINSQVTLFTGYALVSTHPSGKTDRTENRLWQQLSWNVPTDGTYKLQFRSRLEERFLENSDDTGWRFREFAKYTRPLTENGKRYLSAWDEVFFDLNDTDAGQNTGLRQNRGFIGLGWFLDDARGIAFEGGYLNQWISRPGDDRMNHALSLNLLMTF